MEPYLGVVVQGHKQVILGETTYSLDASHYLLTSLDLPLGMKVTGATPDCPYLGLTLKLDMTRLTELALQLPASPLPVSATSLIFGPVSVPLLSALTRLVRLLETPKDLPFLAPLVEQELYYHLLTGPQGEQLRQFVALGSQGNRIAKAVKYLTVHFDQPFDLDSLLEHVNISAPTLHRHFRQLIGMTPLQFQKWLRLKTARQRMLTEKVSASTAATQVGYESVSQFTREYRRVFGESPARDIAVLRKQPLEQQYWHSPF